MRPISSPISNSDKVSTNRKFWRRFLEKLLKERVPVVLNLKEKVTPVQTFLVVASIVLYYL